MYVVPDAGPVPTGSIPLRPCPSPAVPVPAPVPAAGSTGPAYRS